MSNSQAVIQAKYIRYESDLVPGVLSQFLIEDDFSSCRTKNFGDQPQQGAFADSVDPCDQANFTFRHVKTEFLKDF
ncbi:MAG: hypothetical protein OEY25_09085 [Candidatus Aminicenantes bacterium]|nr:hypothetical protein [Candidatus Aminicenantes bacterium]